MVAIIKYNAGNIQSVICALKRLKKDYILTDDENEIISADHVIFPGVGEASSAMAYLRSHNMVSLLKNIEKPFLGICLGMQLLSTHSEENSTSTLDIIPGCVKLFEKGKGYKIPHVGWNNVKAKKDDPLFSGIKDGSFFYFVHSYYVALSEYTVASTEYDGICFSSAVRKGNFYGVQFHPEKSGRDGERLIHNFLECI